MVGAEVVRAVENLISWFIALDLHIQAWAFSVQSPLAVSFFTLITYLGSSLAFPILTLIISIYLVSKQKWYEALFLNISLFSAWWLMILLKNLFERSRPAGEALTIASGYSLPSGHAMVSMAFYGYLAVLLFRQKDSPLTRWGAVGLFLLVVMIGFSRIYLNVHYLSDVLAGLVFGFICLRLSLAGLARFPSR